MIALFWLIGILFGLFDAINRFVPTHKDKPSICIDIIFRKIVIVLNAYVCFLY